MEDDKLDLFCIATLVALYISYTLFVIFSAIEMWIAACVALGAFILSLAVWIVLFIIKIVRLRKEAKKWKQGQY